MKIYYVFVIPLLGAGSLLSYFLLPFFLSVVLSPPGTKLDLQQKEFSSPKTAQQYINRANFLMKKAESQQDIRQALSNCQNAEKLAIKKRDIRYPDTLFCQAMAYAYLGNSDWAKKLVDRGVKETRQRGAEELADTFESDYTDLIAHIETLPPLPKQEKNEDSFKLSH